MIKKKLGNYLRNSRRNCRLILSKICEDFRGNFGTHGNIFEKFRTNFEKYLGTF